jgi:hypothetical protein
MRRRRGRRRRRTMGMTLPSLRVRVGSVEVSAGESAVVVPLLEGSEEVVSEVMMAAVFHSFLEFGF